MEFISAFKVPSEALGVLDSIVTSDEVALVENLRAAEFSRDEGARALESASGRALSADEVDERLRSAYRRGVLDLGDESYSRFKIASFYDRLGVFVIAQPAEWLAVPPVARAALDAWFFAAYLDRLSDDAAPTDDLVLPLAEALQRIDSAAEQIWVMPCDCRLLAGACGKPTDTCVSFRGGINTLAHRGWARPLTKAEARAVVLDADAAGLMHTANSGGICNCCSDCCYLFRAQAVRESGPAAWPAAYAVVEFDIDACIECGSCVRRCPFSAFLESGSGITFDEGRCRGCGVCVATCPTGAIELGERVSGA